jgi:hypothetical protein
MRVRGAAFFVVCALLVAPAAYSMSPTTAGEHIFETFETAHPYPTSGEVDSMLTWYDDIRFPGAIYISVHFKTMDLADGDFVVVRSLDGAQKWVYTGYGRNNLGATEDGFFATHIRGDSAIVELYTTGDSTSWGYEIDKFGRGYNDDEIRWYWEQGLGEKMNLARPPEDPESLCGTDDTDEAKCYQASEPGIYDTSRAIARLLLNGSAWCTGWLVGNAGHVMTNEHCITSQSELNNIDFEFMAEGADCSTNCASSLACPGIIEASGGTFIQDSAPMDYALVLPDTSTGTGTNLPATYGFMKLRQTGAVLDERIYHPQHPAGWGKQIGVFSTYPADVTMGGFNYASSLTETACSTGGPPDVGYWTDTQGGSSGSPVLGYSDNKVVALHHCRGSAFCDSGNPTVDDRNRGVPIQDVITDLGPLVPPGALCDPYVGPATLTAVNNGNNTIDLNWGSVAGSVITYKVMRAAGACPQSAYEEIASGIAGTSYSDITVSGGITYSYIVMANNDEGCDSDASPCADETATGPCIEPPVFAGLESVDNPQTSECALGLDWSDATPVCGSSVTYNVYRSETSGFTPGPANLVASCVPTTSYEDAIVENQVEYFYVVRAEDDTAAGGGPCNSGNEDVNTEELSGLPTGPDQVYFADDMESGDGNWAHSGTGDTWTLSTARAHSGTTSFFAVDVDSITDQYLESIAFALPAVAGITFEFWSWQEIEDATAGCFDGGIVEASTDGGTIWTQLLDPVLITIPYEGPVSTTFSNPIAGQDAWCGDPRDWSLYQVDISAYAGQSVQLRFRMATDTSVGGEGWYVDDVRVITPTECNNTDVFADGFESGDTSAWTNTSP